MTAQQTFQYKARDASGSIVSGSIVAANQDDVNRRLRNEGKFLLSIHDGRSPHEKPLDREQIHRNEAAKRVRREDVIAFCQQLSVMLETGVPLAEALDAFCNQARTREARMVMEQLRDDVYAGESLSAAMSRWPRVFPTLMISLMKASEASGTMGVMLAQVGHYLMKERRTAKQIKGALGYPAFMLAFGMVITGFLMVFVLPRFASIYEGRQAVLPLPTKILLSISDFFMTQYLMYVPAGVALAIGIGWWMSTTSGRRTRDWVRLNLPVLRGMYRQLYITRMASTMATLLRAGVNLLDIIEICRGVTNNSYYDTMWDEMAEGVRGGRQMSEIVSEQPFVPAQVASMVAAGERSGRLPDVMRRIAEFSEEELDMTVKQVTSYIEPIMIIAMGAIIGSIALALLLPVFSMGTVMSGG